MRIVVAAATAALLTVVVPSAQAADPATGEVSASQLVQSWTGEAYGEPWKFGAAYQTHQFCIAPICDSFSLDVKDAGNLKVSLVAPGSAGFVDVLVTKPDGTTEFLEGTEEEVAHEMVYEDAKTGTYMFDIWPNELPVAYNGQYNGTAELCVQPFDECFLPPPEDEEEF